MSKHIGYIPRDLSRDNWQICRAEVNGCGNERAISRQKGSRRRRSSLLSEFQIFLRGASSSPSLLRAEFCDSSRGFQGRGRILCAMILPLLFLLRLLPISPEDSAENSRTRFQSGAFEIISWSRGDIRFPRNPPDSSIDRTKRYEINKLFLSFYSRIVVFKISPIV